MRLSVVPTFKNLIVTLLVILPINSKADSVIASFGATSFSGSAPDYAAVKQSDYSISASYNRGFTTHLSAILGVQTTLSSNLSGFYGGLAYDYEPHVVNEENKVDTSKQGYSLKVYEIWNLRGSLAVGRWVFSDQILKSNGRTKVPVRAEDIVGIYLGAMVSRIFYNSYSVHLSLDQLSTLSGSFNASQTSVGLGVGYWLD